MLLLRISVIAVAIVFCAATSPPRYRYPRNYPSWRAKGAASRVSRCAEVKAWVSKSGKQGVGVTVRLTGRGDRPCTAQIAAARFEVAATPVAAAALPEPIALAPGQTQHVYLPFAFDNEAAWNRGDRTGALAIELMFDGVISPELRVEVEHHRGKPHLKIDRYAPPPPQQQPAPQPVQQPPLEQVTE